MLMVLYVLSIMLMIVSFIGFVVFLTMDKLHYSGICIIISSLLLVASVSIEDKSFNRVGHSNKTKAYIMVVDEQLNIKELIELAKETQVTDEQIKELRARLIKLGEDK